MKPLPVRLKSGRWAVALLLLAAAMPGTLLTLYAQGTAPTPRPTRTPLPSITPSPTLSFGPTGQVPPTAASPTATVESAPAQPTPTSPLLVVTSTPVVTAAPTESPIRPGSAPPLTITLPEGWLTAYQRLPIRTAFEQLLMNVAVHRGPVQDGIGTIIILWGFPSIAPPPTIPPLPGTPTAAPGAAPSDFISQMLWTDGLRLLQGTILDITCNVGTAGQGVFSVGGVQGVGTYFNVSQCQGEPDTAGWFAGVHQHGRSYLFYVYIEPITAYNDARGQLQRVLDTVVFLEPTPTPPPTPG